MRDNNNNIMFTHEQFSEESATRKTVPTAEKRISIHPGACRSGFSLSHFYVFVFHLHLSGKHCSSIKLLLLLPISTSAFWHRFKALDFGNQFLTDSNKNNTTTAVRYIET